MTSLPTLSTNSNFCRSKAEKLRLLTAGTGVAVGGGGRRSLASRMCSITLSRSLQGDDSPGVQLGPIPFLPRRRHPGGVPHTERLLGVHEWALTEQETENCHSLAAIVRGLGWCAKKLPGVLIPVM